MNNSYTVLGVIELLLFYKQLIYRFLLRELNK